MAMQVLSRVEQAQGDGRSTASMGGGIDAHRSRARKTADKKSAQEGGAREMEGGGQKQGLRRQGRRRDQAMQGGRQGGKQGRMAGAGREVG
eukprot:2311477-Pleurochrysis_carterae.AAC.1